MSEVLQGWTPRDALRVVFRRWPLFLVGASVFAVAAICWAHYWPLSYTGTAIFERRLDPAGSHLKSESFEGMKRTLIHRLAGREAVGQVIEELGLTQGLPHGPDGQLTPAGNMTKQQLVAEFRGKLQARFQVESTNIDLVSVEFTHEDAKLASEVPNALVSKYMEWVHKNIHARLESSSQFLADQAGRHAHAHSPANSPKRNSRNRHGQHRGRQTTDPRRRGLQRNTVGRAKNVAPCRQMKHAHRTHRQQGHSTSIDPEHGDEGGQQYGQRPNRHAGKNSRLRMR